MSRPVIKAESYLPDKRVSVVTPPHRTDGPVVRLWHGRIPDDREVLRPLTLALARLGVVSVVPDWRSDDSRLRPQQVLASLGYAQKVAKRLTTRQDLVLGGWSLGASAAADLMLHPEMVEGWRPAAFVGIAGPYGESVLEADRLVADRRTGAPGGPCLLIHGSHDAVVPADRTRDAAAALSSWGWSVRVRELPTGHAGVLGAADGESGEMWTPIDDPESDPQLLAVANEIAALAGSLP